MHWRNRRRSENIEDRRGMRMAGPVKGGGVGDDRLQHQARGYITPESFTHGSSEQRVRWFRRGIENGDPGQCNTFRAASL